MHIIYLGITPFLIYCEVGLVEMFQYSHCFQMNKNVKENKINKNRIDLYAVPIISFFPIKTDSVLVYEVKML